MIDIGKYGNSPGVHDRRNGGDERSGRHNHLIARANIQRLQSQVESHRAVCESDGMIASAPGGEFFFKQAAFIAGPIIHTIR